MDTLPIVKNRLRLSEEPPVTLQVVLRGSDGVVVASDRLISLQADPIAFTDRNSKMVIKPRFVCTFAGDDCAKYISTKLAEKAADLVFESSGNFMDAVTAACDEYKGKWKFSETQPRKILWVQFERPGFTIWAATYWACTQNFELCDNPNSVFAGHDTNPARYFVEHYYGKYPMKTVSGLKKMAAHVILAGHLFNSGGVDELEMAIGDSRGFTPVLPDELQELKNKSCEIHAANDAYFCA